MSKGHLEARRLYSTDGKLCEDCGTSEDITRDHKDNNPDNNKQSNIQFLCRTCHGRKDANYRWRNHDKTRQCQWCGNLFEHPRAAKRTCSTECARKLQWHVRKARKAEV